MNAIFYVYVIFRINGQPCYVGKGKGARWQTHKRSHNRHLAKIIAKEGDIPIVKIRTGLTETEAFFIETSFIKAIGRKPNGPLVNMTDGGEGLSNPSEETRKLMRLAKLGKAPSPTWMHEANRGKKKSPDTVEKIRQANLGKKRTPEQRQAVCGREVTDNTRAKMRAAKLGRKQSPEAIEKRIAPHRGKTRPPEWGRKISASKMGHTVSAETRAKISTTKRAKSLQGSFEL